MGRSKSFVFGLILATALTGACASMGERSISEVQTNPGKFHDKTVTVEGVVTTSFGIPFVPLKVFRVSDGSAEMLVISDDSRIPGKNARVRVRDVTFPPGVPDTGMHTHEYAHVGVILTDGQLVFTDKDGKKETASFTSGSVGFREANATHMVANPGTKPMRVIEVELK